MPKVSIIVPIYGVERYIARCLDSLFQQTLDDIQFIFVDDCTPDQSMSILDAKINEYRHQIHEENIVIVRMPENGGLNVVRKKGLQYASGEYILHCDSDDWLELDACRLMYEKAVVENADVVICDFSISDGGKICRKQKGCSSLEKVTLMGNMLLREDPWSIWNKMFKRTTCYDEKIVYPKGAMGEDMVLTLQLMERCKNISYIPQSLYNYYFNPESISHAATIEKQMRNFKQMKDNLDIILDYFNRKGLDMLYKDGLFKQKWMTKCMLLEMPKNKDRRKLWIDTYHEINKKVLFSKMVTNEEKIKYILTYFGLYPRCQR